MLTKKIRLLGVLVVTFLAPCPLAVAVAVLIALLHHCSGLYWTKYYGINNIVYETLRGKERF